MVIKKANDKVKHRTIHVLSMGIDRFSTVIFTKNRQFETGKKQ
jgi:hypothetical protein